MLTPLPYKSDAKRAQYSVVFLWLLYSTLLISSSFCYTASLLINFAQPPRNAKQHIEWNDTVNKAIIYLKKQFPSKPATSIAFTNKQYELGHFTLTIPDTIPIDSIINKLDSFFAKRKVPAHIVPNVEVTIHQPTKEPDLQEATITLDQKVLADIKRGGTTRRSEKELEKFAKSGKKETPQIKQLKENLPFLKQAERLLNWHWKTPTIGLLLTKPFYPPPYPFAPHYFSLWELAPNKGKGVTVGVLDTGVAAFNIEGYKQYKKNPDLEMKENFSRHSFNVISYQGLDPLHQLALAIEPYLQKELIDLPELEQQIPEWIQAFLQMKSTTKLEQYLKQKGIPTLFDPDGTITSKGKEVINLITTGPRGIASQEHPLTLANLISPKEKNAITQFIPTEWTTTGHGSHVFGLIAGKLQSADPANDPGSFGIAPNAHTIMIKVFGANGKSDLAQTKQAIVRALSYNIDILNASYGSGRALVKKYLGKTEKLTDHLLSLIPYVIASSGNDGIAKENYPAYLPSIAFDVGAFDPAGRIASFSQYVPFMSPKVVAPGVQILSATVSLTDQPRYMFANGTSMAAPIISGFTALVLGEFKTDFTKEQLLKTIYRSTIRLNDTENWFKKTLLGAIDMRTALLTLHILRTIKKKLTALTSQYPFDDKFENLLKAVHYLLFKPVNNYGKTHLDNISFKVNFNTYFKMALQKQTAFSSIKKSAPYFIPEGTDKLNNTVNHYTQLITEALNKNNKAQTDEKLKDILFAATVDLFPTLSSAQKQRLSLKKPDRYWTNAVKKIKATLSRWF